MDALGELIEEDEVEYAYQKLKRSWQKQKLTRTKNALFKAIILAYKCKSVYTKIFLTLSDYTNLFAFCVGEYLSALMINILTTMLNLSSPYMIKKIIDFINNDQPNKNTWDGLTYVILLVVT